jgi:hypothetical protein
VSDAQIILPVTAATRADVGRLLREVEGLDDFMHQATLRKPGSSLKLPKSSKLFDDLVSSNQLNMLHEEDRKKLRTFLMVVKAKAPVLHMSFSADPSPLFLEKLMVYIRREIHPLALLHTGLQPTIGAGCVLRTTNKYFDFSIRQRFLSKRPVLLEKLRTDMQEHPAQSAGVQA